MSPRWRWFLPGYLWSLPVVLVGFIFAAFYGCTSWRWVDGVLTCVSPRPMVGNPAGQTFGWLSMYSSEKERATPYMRVHEYCHTAQTFVLGVLWFVAYGIMWLVEYAHTRDFWAAYRADWFEDEAYTLEAHFVADGKRRWGSEG
jgi:hypothetical protein